MGLEPNGVKVFHCCGPHQEKEVKGFWERLSSIARSNFGMFRRAQDSGIYGLPLTPTTRVGTVHRLVSPERALGSVLRLATTHLVWGHQNDR